MTVNGPPSPERRRFFRQAAELTVGGLASVLFSKIAGAQTQSSEKQQRAAKMIHEFLTSDVFKKNLRDAMVSKQSKNFTVDINTIINLDELQKNGDINAMQKLYLGLNPNATLDISPNSDGSANVKIQLAGNEQVLPLKKENVDAILQGTQSAGTRPLPSPPAGKGLLDDIPETPGVKVLPRKEDPKKGLLDQ